MQFDFEPRLKISSNKIILFDQFHGNKRPHAHTDNTAVTSSDRPYSLFADGSRKRLRENLSRWIQTVKFGTQLLRLPIKPITKYTFITLTLSSAQRHCDKILKRELLNHFIITLKNNYGLKNYIWKAEVQQNGNLHYHLLQDTYIPHKELRTIWNGCQNKLGYVDEFARTHLHADPNSSDIHGLRKVRNVEAYVSKYMSKSETSRPICGHTWGRSDSINKLSGFVLTRDIELHDWYNMTVASVPNREFRGDRFCINLFHTSPNWRTLPAHHRRSIRETVISNLAVL